MEKSFFEKYKTSEVTNTRRVINTPSAFTRENFFYIQEAGYLKSLKPHLSRRSGLSSYLFLTVLSGSGEVSYLDAAAKPDSSDRERIRDAAQRPAQDAGRASASERQLRSVHAVAGDCFFLDCSSAYTHISSEDDPWELLWIHFYGPQSSAYYSRFRSAHGWHFRSAHLSELTASILTIIHCHEEQTDDSDLLTAQQIVNILTVICTESAEPGGDPSLLSDKLKSIQQYLDEHYTQDISLDCLAEQFYISKYYLSREFKREFGTTIIRYVLSKKITNAKELLRYSNASIEEIAQLCGIGDASYFNKVFKKIEGCTASEYRKRW